MPSSFVNAEPKLAKSMNEIWMKFLLLAPYGNDRTEIPELKRLERTRLFH